MYLSALQNGDGELRGYKAFVCKQTIVLIAHPEVEEDQPEVIEVDLREAILGLGEPFEAYLKWMPTLRGSNTQTRPIYPVNVWQPKGNCYQVCVYDRQLQCRFLSQALPKKISCSERFKLYDTWPAFLQPKNNLMRFATHKTTGRKVVIYAVLESQKDSVNNWRLMSLWQMHGFPQIYDLIQMSGWRYIVARLYQGQSLVKEISQKADKRLTESQARNYFKCVLTSMTSLLTKGKLLRSVHPRHILIEKHSGGRLDRVILTDLSQSTTTRTSAKTAVEYGK